jgi:ABC-type dipeptide/oligopeptide/nickel transport system permease component
MRPGDWLGSARHQSARSAPASCASWDRAARLLQMIPVIIGATFLIFVMVFALAASSAQSRIDGVPDDVAQHDEGKVTFRF